MASGRQLKTRVRSVKNTRQITRAMELVAASKMRRAQQATQASLLYSRVAREILTYLGSHGSVDRHPLYEKRTVKSRLLIIVTGNKGLAGAYNSNIIKRYISELQKDVSGNVHNQTIVIGKKGAQSAMRIKNTEVIGVYTDSAEAPNSNEVKAIMGTAVGSFLQKRVDAVDLIFTEYINSINQKVAIQRLLPAGFAEVRVGESVRNAVFEPSEEAVLEGATIRLLRSQLYQALLDSAASEQSMRMVAMKSATDNANDLVDDLTLEMNKLRQAGITQELSEISAGVEAMK